MRGHAHGRGGGSLPPPESRDDSSRRQWHQRPSGPGTSISAANPSTSSHSQFFGGPQSTRSYHTPQSRQVNRRHPPPKEFKTKDESIIDAATEKKMDTTQYTNPKHFNAYTGANTPPRDKRRGNGANAGDNVPGGGGGPSHARGNASAEMSPARVELTGKLSQYTRGADRRQVLRSLMDPHLLPRMHALKSVWVEDIAAAEREAAGERAALNGVKFLQVKSPTSVSSGSDERPSNPVDSYFLQTLREICGHMCDMDGVDADPMALYGGLLLRLSRSVSERDALEVITSWCCGKGELVVLPLKRRHHDPSARPPAPIDLELYVESGNVHAKATMSHELGIYRRTDLESHGLKRELSPWNALVLANQNPSMRDSSIKKLGQIQYEALLSPKFATPLKPWVFVDADVVERINFGTGSSVRMLHLRVPQDKNSGYVKKW